jgi:SAM-dependent methyltransferase
MHESVRAWIASEVAEHGLADLHTLEVGSLDVNGSIADLFTDIIGVDMREGPGVDRVMDAHALEFPDAAFDAVVCCEMVEHDAAFWLSLAEIGRVLRPGGTLLLTTRGNGFPEHSYPWDYWRFMPNSGGLLSDLASCDLAELHEDPQVPGIFLRAIRR